MKGTIPTENGLLTSLLSFNLEFNHLEGSIPTELCNLSNLQVLALGNNKFSKTIPACIGEKMHQLEHLFLDHNDFTGQLPTSLGDLKNLERLFLTDNLIRGDPSTVFNRLQKIKILLANQNMFQAHIDRNFLPKHNTLEWLDLGSNQFLMLNASLPTHLFKLPALQVLDISLNRFEGTFPTSIPENKVLRYFSAYGNTFKGDIPSALKNLKKLEHLDLSANHFHGDLHSALGHMTHLRFLYLGDNPKLHHAPIPTWLANLTQLHDLSLHDTNRTGEIPSFIGNLTKLEFLDLSSNKNLAYNMSASNWGHLKNLTFLVLNGMPNVTGTIPSSFSSLHKLRAVFLDATSISGNVESLCVLPEFADPKGNEVIFANCAGAHPQFNCTCCSCCSSTKGCSEPYLGEWMESFELDARKLNYEFDDLTRFYDIVELPNKTSVSTGSTNHSLLL
jgi:Leucine-rich repeat (LRR) protein